MHTSPTIELTHREMASDKPEEDWQQRTTKPSSRAVGQELIERSKDNQLFVLAL